MGYMKTSSTPLLAVLTFASLALCACDPQSGTEVADSRDHVALAEAEPSAEAADEARLIPITLVDVRAVDEQHDAYEMTLRVDNRDGATLGELALTFAPAGDDDSRGAVVHVDDELAAGAVTELTVLAEGLDLSASAVDEGPFASDASRSDTLVREEPDPLARMVWKCTLTNDGYECVCVAACAF
jgi:hypothetical protein